MDLLRTSRATTGPAVWQKLRIKQYLKLCMHLIPDADRSAFTATISKYEEILSICEKCMHEMLPKTPKNVEEAAAKRQAYIGMLQRCRELEEETFTDYISENNTQVPRVQTV